MIKKLQTDTIQFIQFTPEELEELNLEPNTKFTISEGPNKSITLTPYKKISIDLDQFDINTLQYLIKTSCEKDISVNEVIEEILQNFLTTHSAETSSEDKLED